MRRRGDLDALRDDPSTAGSSTVGRVGLRGALALHSMMALLAGPAAAQATGAVVGLVTDSTGGALSGVLVFVDDGAPAVLTDELGMFGLSGVTLERHVLSYRRAGYAPRSFALDLTGAEDFRDVGTVVLGPGPTPTATLTGRVTDGDGGPGLAGATIALNGRVVAVTDSSGAFDAPSSTVVWGPNELTVEHRAFAERTVNDRIWVANLDETFDFTVALGIVPVALPEVGVEIPSRVLAQSGFYERRRDFNGRFLTREDIIATNPRNMDDLLRGRTGASPGRRRAADTFGNVDAHVRECIPLFFVDGQRVGELNLRPEMIEGLEIYDGLASTPARFSPIGATCGAVVVWTR